MVGFFNGVMPVIDDLADNCFYRGVAPSEMKSWTFPELKRWGNLSKEITSTETKAWSAIGGNRKKS